MVLYLRNHRRFEDGQKTLSSSGRVESSSLVSWWLTQKQIDVMSRLEKHLSRICFLSVKQRDERLDNRYFNCCLITYTHPPDDFFFSGGSCTSTSTSSGPWFCSTSIILNLHLTSCPDCFNSSLLVSCSLVVLLCILVVFFFFTATIKHMVHSWPMD